MKAILIDVKKKEIREVEIERGIDAFYKLIDCRCFTVASILGDGNAIYVDDEGYLNDTKEFFKLKSLGTQWFAGNGLIVRENISEESVDHTIDMEELKNDVVFMACDDSESCPELPPIQIVSF